VPCVTLGDCVIRSVVTTDERLSMSSTVASHGRREGRTAPGYTIQGEAARVHFFLLKS